MTPLSRVSLKPFLIRECQEVMWHQPVATLLGAAAALILISNFVLSCLVPFVQEALVVCFACINCHLIESENSNKATCSQKAKLSN